VFTFRIEVNNNNLKVITYAAKAIKFVLEVITFMLKVVTFILKVITSTTAKTTGNQKIAAATKNNLQLTFKSKNSFNIAL